MGKRAPMKLFQWHRVRGSQYFGLLFVLVATIFIYPLLERFDAGGAVLAILAALIPVMAIVALVEDRRELIIGVILGVPAVAAMVQEGLGMHLVGPLIVKTFPLLLYLFASAVIIRHVIVAPEVKQDTIVGAIAGYLMLGYTWYIAYLVIELSAPGSFGGNVGAQGAGVGTTLLYFSFVTLTTLGYGDVLPISSQARSLAMLESMTGVLYLAVLVSRIIGAYAGKKRTEAMGQSSRPPEGT